MGGISTCGSFRSDDYRYCIRKMQLDSITWAYDSDRGLACVDIDEAYYGGKITLVKFKEVYEYGKHSVKDEHDAAIYVNNVVGDKFDGRIFEGPIVGYRIYRPVIEKINNSFNEFTRDLKTGEYIIIEPKINDLECRKITSWTKNELKEFQKYRVCKNYSDAEEAVKRMMYLALYKKYIITNKFGDTYRCYMNCREVNTTKQVSELKKKRVLPVRNYYWAAIVGT